MVQALHGEAFRAIRSIHPYALAFSPSFLAMPTTTWFTFLNWWA